MKSRTLMFVAAMSLFTGLVRRVRRPVPSHRPKTKENDHEA